MKYREGAVGALMDEYKRAIDELIGILKSVSSAEYGAIVDNETDDADCRSIRSVMNHVVRAGYGYSNYIRRQFGDAWTERKDNYEIHTAESAIEELNTMFGYSMDTMNGKWHLTFDEMLGAQMETSWEQVYDFEQLQEHAIVHILRHRRQIEKFLATLR